MRILVGVAVVSLAFVPGLGHSQSSEEIFAWTMQQMNIEHPVAPPEVQWVDGNELKQVFTENNRNAYMQWKSQYGADQANEIMHSFLEEILGLFIVETQVVYVGNFIEPCRRQSILAHEFVHYLQQVTQGPVTGYGEETERLKWLREFEAQNIETLFVEQFCKANAPDKAVALR